MMSVKNSPVSESLFESSSVADITRDPLGLTPLPVDSRKRFLKFVLSKDQQTLLPLSQVLEVIQISPDDILSVPDMPSCILGICPWKGETLWLVDLNVLVGYEALYHRSVPLETASVVVVQKDNRTLGLVVEHVSDIDLFDEGKIRVGTGLCPPKLEPFVLGYFPQQGDIVIDVDSTLNAPQLHTYQRRS